MGKGGERPPQKDEMVASEFAWSEVTKHRSPEDGWLMINNKIYDVSGWHDHPGGDVRRRRPSNGAGRARRGARGGGRRRARRVGRTAAAVSAAPHLLSPRSSP